MCAGTLLLHHDLGSPHTTPEIVGVLHCITVRIIVKIREDVQSVGQVLVDLGSLSCEGLVCVAATIADPVKAQVSPVSGEVPRMGGDEVMDTEGGRRIPQDGVDLVAEPPWITKFDGPAVGARYSLEEAGKSSGIRSPARWQLDENRAKALSEPTRPLEESLDQRVRLFQTLQVRTIAAELQRIAEVRRSLLTPHIEALSLWQMVESVVDLHGIKMASVVGKPTLLRETPRVENLLPVVIVIARGPDPKLSSFGTHASVGLAHS
jgi:hypothetical protein